MQEQEIIKILDTYFNREDPPKFINVSRIPLICQDISVIRSGINDLKESINVRSDDHEERIRKLEQRIWQWIGASGVVGALAVWALQKFT